MSYSRWSVRAARFVVFAIPTFSKEWLRTHTWDYQRRHYPDGPQRRCSIHNRPTCPFSADDGAYAGHWKGPRPVSYEINLRFRRFSCGTGQITGLNTYYIGLTVPFTTRASSDLRPHDPGENGHQTRICDHQPVYHYHGPWRDHLFHDRLTCARSR